MPFIGNQPALSYTSFAKQDFTTSATTSYTLDNPVTNENELALFINFVRQEPTTAYTASGTTLTLTSATSASDDMYCVFLGKAVQTVNPPSGSVGTSQLADDAVTKAKTSALMYPAFQASMSADQSVTNSNYVKVQFDTKDFDTDGCYDNVTNYRFTPTVAGKYFFYITTRNNSVTDTQLDINLVALYKNGTRIRITVFDPAGNYGRSNSPTLNHIETANGTTDYFEAYVYVADQSGTPNVNSGEDSIFGAYRIGD